MFELISSGFNELLALVENINPVYIYLILFGMAFLENLFPPLPGDTFTIIGGYLAAAGKLNWQTTLGAVSLGTILSVMLIYYWSYHHGRGYFIRKRLRIFNAYDIRRVRRWFDRFGVWTLVFSRFVVGGRVAIALGAGMSQYRPLPMTVFSLISALLFHGFLIALSFLMYAYISRLVAGFDLYAKIILVIVGAVIIIWTIIVIRRYLNARSKT